MPEDKPIPFAEFAARQKQILADYTRMYETGLKKDPSAWTKEMTETEWQEDFDSFASVYDIMGDAVRDFADSNALEGKNG